MNSQRWRIASAMLNALRQASALEGAVVLDNPRDPQAIRAGNRLVFFEEQSDRFIDQAGQQGRRRYVFTLGVIVRGVDDRAGADADYESAEAAIRGAHGELMRDLRCGPLREIEVVFRVEGIDVGGALVMGTFEIEYLKPRPQ